MRIQANIILYIIGNGERHEQVSPSSLGWRNNEYCYHITWMCMGWNSTSTTCLKKLNGKRAAKNWVSKILSKTTKLGGKGRGWLKVILCQWAAFNYLRNATKRNSFTTTYHAWIKISLYFWHISDAWMMRLIWSWMNMLRLGSLWLKSFSQTFCR